MKKYLCICIFLLYIIPSFAQNKGDVQISGTVYDEFDVPMPGVTVAIKNRAGIGVLANSDGVFSIKADVGEILTFSMIGYLPYEYKVSKTEKDLKIKIEPVDKSLSEVVVTGMGASQRKISIVGAVTNVDVEQLQTPATSISNMLGGRVPGIISRQTSGEPGKNISEFWVRGIGTFGANSSALVLIDGLEGSLDNIDPADIESFSVLKDASATAVYGVRGANGVVLVTTKRGQTNKLQITARANMTISHLNRMPDYLRAHDYAQLANEARLVRGQQPIYSQQELYIIKNQLDPDLYPDVNWRDEILNKTSLQQTYYISARGGGSTARYFVSVGMSDEESAYKQDKSSKYRSNVGYNKYTYRTNIDMNLTPTTKLYFGSDGDFTKRTAPGIGNTNDLWRAQFRLNPLSIPTRYSTGQLPAIGEKDYDLSPWVALNHTGLVETEKFNSNITLALDQNLSFLLKGLTIRGQAALTNYSESIESRTVRPQLWRATGRMNGYQGGDILFREISKAEAVKYSNEQYKNRKIHFESTANYETLFGENHRFSALLYYYMTDLKYVNQGEESSMNALPYRNQGVSSRLTYGFKDTYFVDFNWGYTGSANFKKGDRFGFFPAIAGGWIPTNYKAVQNLVPWFDFLKIRASYGLVGNDRITDKRFPYLTELKDDSSVGWGFGGSGIIESYIGADNLKWEKAKKFDVGIEGRLFKEKVEFTIDFFKDQRDGIFQPRAQIPSYVGLINMPYGNVGKMKSWGSDGNISFYQIINKDMSFTIRGNFTYSNNKVQNWEQAFEKYPYMERTGWQHNVARGLVALGLFVDDDDIANSPKQTMGGTIRPGDIKYKDVNGDGVVNEEDMVPMAYRDYPRLMYGFGGDFKYKNLTVGFLFNGIGKRDFFWTSHNYGEGYVPFLDGTTGNVLSIVNDPNNRWIPSSVSGTKDTENPNARFPRLAYGSNHNNNRPSSFWLGNSRYLRLQEVNINYRLQLDALRKVGVSSMDIQLVGMNLYVWDSVKLWDPEFASQGGQAYPIPARYALQLYINF